MTKKLIKFVLSCMAVMLVTPLLSVSAETNETEMTYIVDKKYKQIDTSQNETYFVEVVPSTGKKELKVIKVDKTMYDKLTENQSHVLVEVQEDFRISKIVGVENINDTTATDSNKEEKEKKEENKTRDIIFLYILTALCATVIGLYLVSELTNER